MKTWSARLGRAWAWFVVAAMATALAACGGGDEPTYSVSLDKQSVTLTGNASTAKVQVEYQGAGLVIGTPPGVPMPEWLSVTPRTTSATSMEVTLGALPTGQAPGRYTTTIRFVTGDESGGHVTWKDLPVAYEIPIPVGRREVVLYGAPGGTLTGAGLSVFPWGAQWTAEADVPWLSFTYDHAAAGSSYLVADHLGVTGSAAGLDVGDHHATIHVIEPTTGMATDVSVVAHVEAPRLVVRRHAVALSALDGAPAVPVALSVEDTGAGGLAWTARVVSGGSWLRIDRTTGKAGQALTFSAVSTGLAEGVHRGRVEITPVAGGVTEVVEAGLYVGPGAPAPGQRLTGLPGGMQSTATVADPLRPYAYAIGMAGRIVAVNVHTGAVTDLVLLSGKHPAGATISPDGRTLWVVDTAQGDFLPIDLDTLAVGAAVPGTRWVPVPTDIGDIARVAGHDLVVAPDSRVLDLTTGASLASLRGLVWDDGDDQVNVRGAFSHDGRWLAALAESAYHGTHLQTYHVSLDGGALQLVRLVGDQEVRVGASYPTLKFTADDARLLFAHHDQPGVDATGRQYAGVDIVFPVTSMPISFGAGLAADGSFYQVTDQRLSGVPSQLVHVDWRTGATTPAPVDVGYTQFLQVSGDQRRVVWGWESVIATMQAF